MGGGPKIRTRPTCQHLDTLFGDYLRGSQGFRSERAGWIGETEEALFWVDLGDVVDADQEPRSPEQTGADFENCWLVGRFSVADAGDAADPFGRGLDEKAFAAAQPVGAVVARAKRCPRQESNLRTRFRKPLLYPLSYGGFMAQPCDLSLVVLYPLYR